MKNFILNHRYLTVPQKPHGGLTVKTVKSRSDFCGGYAACGSNFSQPQRRKVQKAGRIDFTADTICRLHFPFVLFVYFVVQTVLSKLIFIPIRRFTSLKTVFAGAVLSAPANTILSHYLFTAAFSAAGTSSSSSATSFLSNAKSSAAVTKRMIGITT